MKRGLALLMALLTALALTACGGGGYSGGDSAAGPSASPSATASSSGGSYYGMTADLDAPADAQEEWVDGELEVQPEDGRLANAKMVYTANIAAETMDFDACAADLEALVEEMGGYMEYASSSSYSDGLRAGSYTVRIPSARFKAFLNSVGQMSHVTSQDKSAENISELYYDTESRLVTQQTKLERLQMLLAKAENMEDIISLESAIAETELQIEQLTGSLRHYDALVDYATIELRLREVARFSTVEETPPTFASQLGNAFTNGLRGFGDFLQGLALFLAYNWTWIVLLAVILFLVVYISKRRQSQRAQTFSQARERKSAFFRRGEKDGAKKPDDKQEKD